MKVVKLLRPVSHLMVVSIMFVMFVSMLSILGISFLLVFFEKVHCDLWGPYRYHSSCGARYLFIVVDEFSLIV